MEPEAPATAAQLREFVLHVDLKLQQLRTDIASEFGKVHASLARLEAVTQTTEARFARLEQRLNHQDDRMLRYDRALLTTTAFSALVAGVALAASLFTLFGR